MNSCCNKDTGLKFLFFKYFQSGSENNVCTSQLNTATLFKSLHDKYICTVMASWGIIQIWRYEIHSLPNMEKWKADFMEDRLAFFYNSLHAKPEIFTSMWMIKYQFYKLTKWLYYRDRLSSICFVVWKYMWGSYRLYARFISKMTFDLQPCISAWVKW